MKFDIIDYHYNGIMMVIPITNVRRSFLLSINQDGLCKHSTGYPQIGIDYDRDDGRCRIKIVGVDVI